MKGTQPNQRFHESLIGGRSNIFLALAKMVLPTQANSSQVNPFTPELKKYILPTFWRENA